MLCHDELSLKGQSPESKRASGPHSNSAAASKAPVRRDLGVPQIVALSVVTALVGSGFSSPASAATPEDVAVQSAIVTSESTPATDLMRLAEDEILKDRMDIDAGETVVGVVEKKNKIKTTKRKNISTVNSGWVTPVKKYGISAVYGQAGGWSSGHHTGLDFTAPQGSAVVAASAGKVTSTQYEGAYGNLVQIRHKGGVSTWYAHLDSTKVKKGDTVKAGQKIGTVGMTGRTSGPHLHFEVRKGKENHLNPAHYIWKNKKFPKGTKRG